MASTTQSRPLLSVLLTAGTVYQRSGCLSRSAMWSSTWSVTPCQLRQPSHPPVPSEIAINVFCVHVSVVKLTHLCTSHNHGT